jgi:membrane protein DedA with SNARE-associated domain
MPALAGTARMPYRRFIVFNAAGGLLWGVGFVLVGYLTGNSYAAVTKTIGQTGTVIAVGVVVVAFAAWRIRRHRRGDHRIESGP